MTLGMPTLRQVQDYIHNRRRAIGDTNNIPDLEAFLSQSAYVPGETPDHRLFTFGVQLGDGSDAEHFHLGMTSKTLLENITRASGNTYAFDCTYKVIKYIVFNKY